MKKARKVTMGRQTEGRRKARCVHVCVYVPREDIEPPAGGVTRGCEKTDMSARNNLGSSGSGILC